MNKIIPKQDSYMVGSGLGKGMKKEKSKPVYPKFRIGLEHLPEAKNMKLGDHVHLGIHGKVSALNQGGYDNSAEFEMHGIEHKKMKKGDKETGPGEPESTEDEQAEGQA